jgi:hypothetical protein
VPAPTSGIPSSSSQASGGIPTWVRQVRRAQGGTTHIGSQQPRTLYEHGLSQAAQSQVHTPRQTLPQAATPYLENQLPGTMYNPDPSLASRSQVLIPGQDSIQAENWFTYNQKQGTVYTTPHALWSQTAPMLAQDSITNYHDGPQAPAPRLLLPNQAPYTLDVEASLDFRTC